MDGYILVIGAANVDIGGRSFTTLKERDSNPGRITYSLGGVGRNIAHNLRLLEVPVKLMTVFGDDYWTIKLREVCVATGIDISLTMEVQGELTPAYTYISNPEGDMQLALSDTELFAKLTPEYFQTHIDEINGARVVVFDTNIPTESILWLAENCTAPLIADPVSVAKAERLRDALPRLFAIKPNILEAELLTGICIETDFRLKKAADALLSAGVKNVFISLGEDGIFAKNADIECQLPCMSKKLVNNTGGGDAAIAAIIWAYFNGLDIRDAALASQAAAALTVEHRYTINPDLSPEAVRARMSAVGE